MSRPSTAYLAAWAAKQRAALFDQLGRVCALCARTEEEAWNSTGEGLQFDHPHGRDYDLRRLNRWSRVIQYERDLAAGNLRVLCASCNRGGAGRRYAGRRRGQMRKAQHALRSRA